MDLKIKAIQKPLDIPKHESDAWEKEMQDRMSKDYWLDHIRDLVKMVLIRG